LVSRSPTLVFRPVRKNRNQFAIATDILKAIKLKKSRKKTQIMQSANLSTHLANKYLGLLLRNGYVILGDGNTYTVTRKGLSLVQNIEIECQRLQFKR